MKKKLEKLFVIPYGADKFEGDSAFYCPEPYFNYKEGMTLEDVRKEWVEMTAQGCGKSEREGIELTSKDIVGAWVVDQKTINASGAVWNSDPGNDSAVYHCNSAAKEVVDEICVKEIKK